MKKSRIKYLNGGTIFLIISVSLIIINRLVSDKNVLKITLLIYIILLLYKIVTIGISFNKYYKNEVSFKRNIVLYLKENNPVLYNILAQESLIFTYAFLTWRKSKTTNLNSFESYRQNPNIAIYVGFLFVLLVEVFIVDLVLVKLSLIFWARISIVSTFYLMAIFLAYLKALKYRTTTFSDDYLSIKYGIDCELKLPYESLRLTDESNDSETIVPLGLLTKMEVHNILIYFKTTQSVSGLYGKKKEGNGISFYISDSEKFKIVLSENLQKVELGA